jgi:trigger factor
MGNDQQQYVNYLRRVGQSDEDFREGLREAAEGRVKRALVLGQFADDEALEVGDEEVEAELETLIAPMGDDAGRFREMFATPEGKATIRRNLHSKKTLERLAAYAAGQPPEEQSA